MLVIASFILTPLVGAQTPPATETSSNQSTRCTIAQGRLNLLITKIETTKSDQTTTFKKIQERISATTVSAAQAGFDTMSLGSASTDVSAKVTAYTAMTSEYATSLMATKNLSCGESDAEFNTSLTASRAALTKTREASLAVRTAISKSAIPALKEYAAWLSAQTSTEETK